MMIYEWSFCCRMQNRIAYDLCFIWCVWSQCIHFHFSPFCWNFRNIIWLLDSFGHSVAFSMTSVTFLFHFSLSCFCFWFLSEIYATIKFDAHTAQLFRAQHTKHYTIAPFLLLQLFCKLVRITLRSNHHDEDSLKISNYQFIHGPIC